MSEVKLELQKKNYEELETFAISHRDAMVGNPNFLDPVPSVMEFNGTLSNYVDKLAEVKALKIGLATAMSELVVRRGFMDDALTGRGGYIQTASGGEESKILSAAFDVQSERTPTTSMPKPTGLSATMGDNPGEIDVGCDAVAKAKTYVYEVREHSDTAAPGPWSQARIVSRSSATVEGLDSGKRYAFRIRALGPNELESPWSDEVACMAP